MASAFTSHCTVRVLYTYFVTEETVKVVVVPVQKMLRWLLVFSRKREQPPARTRLVLMSLTPARCQRKKCCLHASGVYLVSSKLRTKLNLSEFLL